MSQESKRCKYEYEKLDSLYTCHRERFAENDEFCVFHSRDIENKKDQFALKWKEEFGSILQPETIKEDLCFIGFIFPHSIDFSHKIFLGKLDFTRVEFLGEVTDFSYSDFSHGFVPFGESLFSAVETNFSHTKFKGAFFMASKFTGSRIDFNKSIFEGADLFFEDVICSGDIDFSGCDFNCQRTNFAGSRFSGSVTSFYRAIFRSNETHLYGIQFLSERTDFRWARFENYYFLSISSSYFENVIGLFEFGVLKTRAGRFLRTQYKFKEFTFHLGVKSIQRYPILSRLTRDAIYLKKFKADHPLLYKFWWLFADCGRSILRWTLWSLLIAFAFAFIYHNIFYLADPDYFHSVYISRNWPGFSFIYFSIVTFTTLGFGDIIPRSGWLQFWIMLEVILGYIMLGGLISILANKLARRFD